MHLFYTPDIATTLELPQDEAAHALRVLRNKKTNLFKDPHVT